MYFHIYIFIYITNKENAKNRFENCRVRMTTELESTKVFETKNLTVSEFITGSWWLWYIYETS